MPAIELWNGGGTARVAGSLVNQLAERGRLQRYWLVIAPQYPLLLDEMQGVCLRDTCTRTALSSEQHGLVRRLATTLWVVRWEY